MWNGKRFIYNFAFLTYSLANFLISNEEINFGNMPQDFVYDLQRQYPKIDLSFEIRKFAAIKSERQSCR